MQEATWEIKWMKDKEFNFLIIFTVIMIITNSRVSMEMKYSIDKCYEEFENFALELLCSYVSMENL